MGNKRMWNIYHGYVVFVSTFVLSVVSIGVFNACSLFLDSLNQTFAAKEDSNLAVTLMPFWITIQVVVGLASSMGGGPVQDWLSEVAQISMPYQFMIFGGGLIAGGLILSSYATSIWILLLGAVLMGIGIGFNGFISAAICVLWFDSNRGTMLLLALSGRGLGSMASSMIIAKLLNAYDTGDDVDDPWRPVMRIVGLSCFFIGAIASLGMRLPNPGEVEAHEATIDLEEEEEEERPLLLIKQDEGGHVHISDPSSPRPKSPTRSPKPATSRPPRANTTAATYGSFQNIASAGTPPSSPTPPSRPGGWASTRVRPSGATVRPSSAFTSEGANRRSSVRVISQMRDRRRSSLVTSQAIRSIMSGNPSTTIRKSRFSVFPTTNNTKRHMRKSSVAEFNALSFAPVDFSIRPDDNEEWEELFKDEEIATDQEGVTVPTFTEVLLSRTSVCLNIWSLVSSFSFLNLQVYLPAYATSFLGLPSSVAGTAMTAFGLGLLVANLTLGPITDRLGANPMLFWSMMGLAFMDFLWPLCESSIAIESVAGVYGFFSATNGCLPLIIVADAFNNVPPNYILMLNGVLNLTKCPGFLVGPTIAALFQSDPDDYASIAAMSWMVMAIGNAFLLLIPSPDNGDDTDNVSDDDEMVAVGENGGELDTLMETSEASLSNRESYQSTTSK